MSDATTWHVAAYKDGDEAEIVSVFNSVFSERRTVEHWKWKFEENPYHSPICSLAIDDQHSKVVGQYAVMPTMLNVAGKAVGACQSLDTMVHPEYRMRGIFEKTASACYSECEKQDIEMVYGFPNQNSYPGFMRKLDWKRICFLERHVFRLAVARDAAFSKSLAPVAGGVNILYRLGVRLTLEVSRRLAGRQLGTDVAILESGTVPEGHDELWNACRSLEVLSIWKDSKYLRWRYDRHPERRFRYLFVRRGTEITALAVLHESEKTLEICELLVKDRDIAHGRFLIGGIIAAGLARDAHRVVFIGYDIGFFKDVLVGFTRTPYSSIVLCARVFRDSKLQELIVQPQNWTITYGDTDRI